MYYQNQLNIWKEEGDTSFKKIGKSGVDQLKAGLNAGVINLQDLKSQFGSQIYDLFPKDLSKASKDEIKTLRAGYTSGVLSLKDLKKHFGDAIYELFPDDLSNLSKKQLSTLHDGLKNGSIKPEELKQKYGKQFDAVFKKDLSSLGQNDIQTLKTGLDMGIITNSDLKKQFGFAVSNIFHKNLKDIGKNDIKTLANGIDAGIPGAQDAMKRLQSAVKSGATIDIKGKGEATMDGLNYAYKNKQITTSQYMDALVALVKGKTNIDLGPNGMSTMNSYNGGLNATKRNAIKTATGTADSIQGELTLGRKAVGAGKDTMTSFDQGLAANAGFPIGTSGKAAKAITQNFDKAGNNSNNLSKSLDGKPSYKSSNNATDFVYHLAGHKTGTNGKLTSAETAVVGDGFKPELIDYGNGALGLSPNVPTITSLPKGAQVFSGEDTEKVAPMLKMMGVPLFAKGSGGNVIDWIKNLFGDAMKFMEHPIKNWEKLIDSSFKMNLFPSGSVSGFGEPTKAWEKKQTNWLKKLEDTIGDIGGGGATYSPSMIKKAAIAMKTSIDGEKLKQLQYLIRNESGGNAHIRGIDDGDGTG